VHAAEAAKEDHSTREIFPDVVTVPQQRMRSVSLQDGQHGIVIYCLRHEIPDMAETELERPYGTLFPP
jgi:hypothetical protein